MTARVFSLPSIVLLFCAFILLLLVAISLPTLPALDIVRCHLPSGLTLDFSGIPMIKEIRVKLLTPSTLFLAEIFFGCIFVSVHSWVFGENASGTCLTDRADAGIQGILRL